MGSIAMGAEIVEIDVRRSKDGQFVVMHDSWLDRTTTCKGGFSSARWPK